MKSFELKNKEAGVCFCEATGHYTVTCGSFVLSDCKPVLRCGGKLRPFGRWRLVKQTATRLSVSASGTSGEWRMDFQLKNGAITVQLTGKLTQSSDQIELFYFDEVSLRADHLLAQGSKMGGCAAIPLKKGTSGNFNGSIQLMITRKGEQLSLSYPLRCQYLPFFKGRTASGMVKEFQAGAEINHCSRKKIALEPLTFQAGNGFELMYAYAEENTTEKKDFASLAVPGWNSWDYYRWTITEEEVLKNAEFIAADPVLSRHVKKIILDDGWQYAYGEWEANSLFPHGMKYLAEQITKLGFEPGIWVAPTVVEPHARIAQMDYDMLAKAESGLPTLCFTCMGRQCFLLDPTVEKSQKFIADTFDRLASFGYRHFKLDFLASTLRGRQFADKTVPRGSMMELTIGTARKAVAGRARLLGCNYLFCGGSELAESVRVGGDVHAVWNSIKANTPSIAARFWANKKLWLNDPDFALCRSFDTANDPDLTRLLPSLVFITPESTDKNHPGLFKLVDIHRPQAEVLLSLVIAAGGAVNLSDNMTRLNESGLDLARRTVSAESGEAAVPLDLFSAELPSYWVQKVGNRRRVLLINWTDLPAERFLNLDSIGISGRKAVNFWNDEPLALRSGSLSAELPPRSCLFAVVS